MAQYFGIEKLRIKTQFRTIKIYVKKNKNTESEFIYKWIPSPEKKMYYIF